MAYASKGSSGNRAATAVVVALLQGAAIYALVTGLAVVFMPPADIPNPEATATPFTPIPIPPEPVETPKARDPIVPPVGDPIVRKPAEPPFIPPIPSGPATGDPTAGAGPVGGEAGAEPTPRPLPTFTPRVARPTNEPGSWATAADYPAGDLRRESQGVARFALTIGTDGRVDSCRITMSSGSPSLDEATCRLVSRRARFKPALGSDGLPVPGSFASAIRWEIPKD